MGLWVKRLFADVSAPVDDVDFLFKTSSTGGAKGLYQRLAGVWTPITGSGGGDAADVTYTPVDNTDWNSSADPGDVNDGLDQLADRAKALEVAVAALAAAMAYTPADATDWVGSVDPGTLVDAADQLAARTKDVEVAVAALIAAFAYSPAILADWNGSADPGDVNDALDQLAERVKDLESAGGSVDASVVGYIPINVNDWISNADPGNVDDALDQLAERVYDMEVASGIGDIRGSAWSVLVASGELVFDSRGDVIMTERLR